MDPEPSEPERFNIDLGNVPESDAKLALIILYTFFGLVLLFSESCDLSRYGINIIGRQVDNAFTIDVELSDEAMKLIESTGFSKDALPELVNAIAKFAITKDTNMLMSTLEKLGMSEIAVGLAPLLGIFESNDNERGQN